MSKTGKLIIVSAPSGAGKTTLCQRLLQDFPQIIVPSISFTTRQPRGEETHGVHYHFTTQEEFKKGIQENQFAEWALVHGNYYGTGKKIIEKSFKEGKYVLLNIDVQGAHSLRSVYPSQNISIFIAPPNLKELEQRLRKRGTDDEKTIQKRLVNAQDEMKKSGEFDKVIVNDTLEKAYQELKIFFETILGGKSK